MIRNEWHEPWRTYFMIPWRTYIYLYIDNNVHRFVWLFKTMWWPFCLHQRGCVFTACVLLWSFSNSSPQNACVRFWLEGRSTGTSKQAPPMVFRHRFGKRLVCDGNLPLKWVIRVILIQTSLRPLQEMSQGLLNIHFLILKITDLFVKRIHSYGCHHWCLGVVEAWESASLSICNHVSAQVLARCSWNHCYKSIKRN